MALSARTSLTSSHVSMAMRFLALLALVFAALPLAAGDARAAKRFPVDSFGYYISEYESAVARIAKELEQTKTEVEAELAAAEAGQNSRLAAVSLEKLVGLDPKNADLWLKLARNLATAQPINDEDNYQLPTKMIGAGLKSYLLASTAADEAQSLAIAAQGFAARETWRPALQAYKESLRLAEDPAVRETYERTKMDHGFRITDYRVENDAMPPRVCFEMSDPPARAVSDFAPYFRLDPGPVTAVTAEGTRLCVEGLKYGQRYTITARKGLPSAVDEDLSRDFEYSIYVRDRSPGVRFAGKSYVLPRTGQNGVPLLTVNSKEARLALYRIGDRSLVSNVLSSNFLAQIDGYTADTLADREGAKVWEGTLETPSPLNEEVATAFPVDEALGKLEPGLYVMTAKPAGRTDGYEYEGIATQWFVVSDLGLTGMSGKDGLHASVRSLASAAPLGDVEVRLIARNNEVLATAQTASDGTATFAPGLTKGAGGQEPAMLVASTAAGDYGFLDLTQPAFDLTDRGVAGREPGLAIDAFVYAERGVYRRGEAVHAAILLRDQNAAAMADLPVTVILERPDGVEAARAVLADQGAGGRTIDFPISAIAAGGTWRIRAYTDPAGDPVGETSFLVEDYIPDRIAFDLKPLSATASLAQGARLTVDGRYLFGAPAAGLDLEANVAVSAADLVFPDWQGYRFGLTDERVETVQSIAADLPQTDINGHAELALRLPDLPSTTRPLRADIAVRMREPGGRTVEQNASLPVRAEQPMIGIRPGFDTGGAPEGQPLDFNAIVLDPDGKRIAAKGAAWTLKRLTYDYQWFNADGSWRYETIVRAAKIDGGTADIGAEKPFHLSRAFSWGSYRLEFSAAGMAPASIDFWAGYYSAGGGIGAAPDKLAVAVDRANAKAGETVNVKIDSRFAGFASLQVVGDRLLHRQEVAVPEGGITVPITVGEGWGTGAYVLASLYRPMDVEAKRMPARAMGLAWFGIDREARSLKVTLAATGTMKPRQSLPVPIKIEGLAAGEEAFVTVAAVDVGILNLTRYQAPAPESHYLDQRRLAADLRDIYGALIDGMQGARGKIRSGGDGGAGFTAPPPTQPPLSLFSGMVKVAADGSAHVAFDIPAFNGTVRLMAVAWTAKKVGQASADVIVRDAVVLQATLPRFLAAGDQSRLRLDLINAEAPAGDYSVGLTVEGPLQAAASSLTTKVALGPAGSRVPVSVPLTAMAAGDARLTARLVGPGDVVIEQSYALHVVPAYPLVTKRTVMELAAKGGAVTLTKDLMEGMVAGSAAVAVSVGPLPDLDAAGLIRDLDRYPYGCSEQTVSRALPLLYLSDLAGGQNAGDDALEGRLRDAVARLLDRQSANGAFGLWSPGESEESLWLTAYVADFLLRARERGYAVPEESLTAALDYLRNSVGNAPDISAGAGQDTAYALYVLARAGKAPVGDLKYLADTRMGDFGSPLAQAQIGSALAILGDRTRAEAAFAAAIGSLETAQRTGDRIYRSDYGSTLRDAAAILALATEAQAATGVIKAAMTTISVERARSAYASTQDMAWMVLAARAVGNGAQAIELDVDGARSAGALYRLLADGDLEKGFRIANRGNGPLRAVVAVSGAPETAEPPASNGLTIARSYYTPEGEPVDATTVAQNTRLVVVLDVSSAGNEANGTYILTDRLPAGLEIENPTLVTSASTASLGWIGETGYVQHTEFRDDRFAATFSSPTLRVAYMVRAVAPGTYVHPGATVEDMYRPELNATGASGYLTVTGP